ncbi:hypothetical protein [Companilactobacillus jidongensis]|uniref:hypothetical protein n=1 Tax=Companilactobacillus jidongensis TaxID=2486006 RepID=UPI000F77D5D7|nr:hypothetical protein [Companilactobacillus jidongensis]
MLKFFKKYSIYLIISYVMFFLLANQQVQLKTGQKFSLEGILYAIFLIIIDTIINWFFFGYLPRKRDK